MTWNLFKQWFLCGVFHKTVVWVANENDPPSLVYCEVCGTEYETIGEL